MKEHIIKKVRWILYSVFLLALHYQEYLILLTNIQVSWWHICKPWVKSVDINLFAWISGITNIATFKWMHLYASLENSGSQRGGFDAKNWFNHDTFCICSVLNLSNPVKKPWLIRLTHATYQLSNNITLVHRCH